MSYEHARNEILALNHDLEEAIAIGVITRQQYIKIAWKLWERLQVLK